MIRNFVQKHISSKRLLKILDQYSKKKFPKKMHSEHYTHNLEVWNSHFQKYTNEMGYIENQSILKELYYGKKSIFFEKIPALCCNAGDKGIPADFNSCEVIALYNALISIGQKNDFPKLLSYFEKRGITLKGYLGTSVLALKRYLDFYGIENELIYYNRNDSYENIPLEYVAYIVTLYNDYRDISKMIHTMCISRENDKYVLHNSYSVKSITGNSIEELILEYGNSYSRIIDIICVGK